LAASPFLRGSYGDMCLMDFGRKALSPLIRC